MEEGRAIGSRQNVGEKQITSQLMFTPESPSNKS